MADHKHSHSALLDAFETTFVRKAFGLSPQHLYAWRMRGIPLAKRVDFARLAEAEGVELPDDFLHELGLSLSDVLGRAA